MVSLTDYSPRGLWLCLEFFGWRFFPCVKSSILNQAGSEAASTPEPTSISARKYRSTQMLTSLQPYTRQIKVLQKEGWRRAACNKSLLLRDTTPDVTLARKEKTLTLDKAVQILFSFTLSFLLFADRRVDVVCRSPLDQLYPTNPD